MSYTGVFWDIEIRCAHWDWKKTLMPILGLNAAVCIQQNCLYDAVCGGQIVQVI